MNERSSSEAMAAENRADREALVRELELAVADFISRLDSDQEIGPDSDLGGEVPGKLRVRSDAESARLAEIGKSMIDEFEASQNRT
jgi:hypothetical protein